MIDIGQLASDRYEIKMIDGKVLHLRKPTQSLLQEIMQLDAHKDESEYVVKELYNVLSRILNLNDEKIEYGKEEIEEQIDIGTALYVVQDYLTEATSALKK